MNNVIQFPRRQVERRFSPRALLALFALYLAAFWSLVWWML